MSEFENETDSGDAASEMPDHNAAQDTRMAQEKANDAKLDKAVRDSAKEVYGRERYDADSVMRKWTGGSIEDTARAAWEKIQARPAPLQMPALPGCPRSSRPYRRGGMGADAAHYAARHCEGA